MHRRDLRRGNAAVGAGSWMSVAVALMAAVSMLALAAGCAQEPSGSGDDEEENLTAAFEELMATEGKADGATCSGVRPPDNSGFGGRIALTFDDGPDLERTPQVLAVLAAHGATGTFFVNGRRITSEAHRQILGQMLADGHIIANHSQNHKNSTAVSVETWRSEVRATHELLAPLWAEAGKIGRFFRFPYGAANCSTYGVVTGFGYSVTGWHIDTADWCFNSSTGGYGYCDPRTFRHVPDVYRNDYVGWVVSQAQRQNGGILLMHDVHRYTAENLDRVLTGLKAAGFSFTRLDDESTFPLLNGVTPPREPWVGDPCEDHSDCGFTSGGESGFCFSFLASDDGLLYGFCSLPCEGFCPDKDGTAPTFCVESPTVGEGVCYSKAYPLNASCAAIPGTAALSRDRFIGESTAREATALVCAPR